jgi:hypothetical protein
MIVRGLALLAVCGACVASAAFAADLPSYHPKQANIPHQKKMKPKRALVETHFVVKTKVARMKTIGKTRQTETEPTGGEVSMTWQLDPLTANSDGAKREDSASVETNLIVPQSANISNPTMVIELTGHVVKTVKTTARLDIRVGKTYRTVSWKSDDIKADSFKITLSQPIVSDPLPEYYPVSALAFVTKEGKDGAAMISLEKVVVRLGKVRAAQVQKQPTTPEVTGSISSE